MNIEKITKYLEDHKVKFEELIHKTVYTAHDVAKTLKTKLEEIGKPLVVKIDGKYTLVLLPANRQLDIDKLKKKLNAKQVEIVSEKIMAKALELKNESVGAFGRLRELPVFVDKYILKNKKVILATSDFTKSIKMAVGDFVKLENAVVHEVSKTKEFKKVKAKVQNQIKKVLKKPVAKKIIKKVLVAKKTAKAIKKAIVKNKVVKKVTKKVVKKVANKKIVKKAVEKVIKKKAVKKVVKKTSKK